MIKFIIKGIIRDKTRSLFPILTVMGGVCLTVIFYTWMLGAMGTMFDVMAKASAGHVKIMTRAYQEIEDQRPLDLALEKGSNWLQKLNKIYPDYYWLARTNFGGLLDFPDENGETRIQGPALGIALNLLGANSPEYRMFNLEKSLVSGRLPAKSGDILIASEYAKRLGVKVGDMTTLISSTVDGGMAIYNFTITGTIYFGVMALDKGTILADITDIQDALNLPDSTTEILGIAKNEILNDEQTVALAHDFNTRFLLEGKPFAPVMVPFRDQSGLGVYLAIAKGMLLILTIMFASVMSIVLWNSGLMNSIRRYGEFGLRLAIGESKQAIYISLVLEALMVGVIGSILGTIIGLVFSYWMQYTGIDISKSMKGTEMFISTIMRPVVNAKAYYVGFLPGIIAPVIGAIIAGITIFKRQTATLFKELES